MLSQNFFELKQRLLKVKTNEFKEYWKVFNKNIKSRECKLNHILQLVI